MSVVLFRCRDFLQCWLAHFWMGGRIGESTALQRVLLYCQVVKFLFLKVVNVNILARFVFGMGMGEGRDVG